MSAAKPVDPLTVFEALWALQGVYRQEFIEIRVILDGGYEETVVTRPAPQPDAGKSIFCTTAIWSYTDVARYIRVDRPEYAGDTSGWMIEAGEERVMLRHTGTHSKGPDDAKSYQHVREGHVDEMEVLG